MAYSTHKKKLSFKILASIFLIATFGFLFVPSIMITTTTTTATGTTKQSDRYSAAAIILGAFDKEDAASVAKINKSGYEGEKIALFMKTEGQELTISDKDTTVLLAFIMLLSVIFCVVAGLLNILYLTKIKESIKKQLNSAIAFFIIAGTICAIISFAMSFYWVSGGYSVNSGADLVRTQVKSSGYLGLLLNMLAPILSFVFFQDRELKE